MVELKLKTVAVCVRVSVDRSKTHITLKSYRDIVDAPAVNHNIADVVFFVKGICDHVIPGTFIHLDIDIDNFIVIK